MIILVLCRLARRCLPVYLLAAVGLHTNVQNVKENIGKLVYIYRASVRLLIRGRILDRINIVYMLVPVCRPAHFVNWDDLKFTI